MIKTSQNSVKYTSIYHNFLDISIIVLLLVPIEIHFSDWQMVLITAIAIVYTLIGRYAPKEGLFRYLYYPSIFGVIILMIAVASVYGMMGMLVALLLIHPLIFSTQLYKNHSLRIIYQHKSRYFIYPIVLFLFLEGISQFLQEYMHTEVASMVILLAYAPFRILSYADEKEENWEQILKVVSISWASYSLYISILGAPQRVYLQTQEPFELYRSVKVVPTKNDTSFQYLLELAKLNTPAKLLRINTKKNTKAQKMLVLQEEAGGAFVPQKWKNDVDLRLQYLMLKNEYGFQDHSPSNSDLWDYFSPIYHFFPYHSRLYMQLQKSALIVEVTVVEGCQFELLETYQIAAGRYNFAIKPKKHFYIIDWERTEEMFPEYLAQSWYQALKSKRIGELNRFGKND